MLSPRSISTLALPVLVDSCATVSHDALTPVEALRQESLTCVVEPGDEGLPRDAFADWTQGVTEGPLSSLTCRLYLVEPELAERALGNRMSSLAGAVCAREDVRALQGELEALEAEGGEVETLAGPIMLAMHDGQRGVVSVVNQEAYISAFEMTSTGDAAIADPRVDVLQDGLVLSAMVDLDPESGAASVELELLISEFQRPFEQVEVSVVRGGPPITMQRPEGILRRVAANLVLGPDEALVFGGSVLSNDDSGRTLLIVLEAEPLDLEDANYLELNFDSPAWR